MKKFFLSILTIATVGFTYAQTADEIVNKHIEAIGGTDAWKKVNSMVTTGTLKMQGAEIPISLTVLNGKGSRQDITVMGMNGYQIVTPTQGWKFMPLSLIHISEPT